jgi:hypothetical protein
MSVRELTHMVQHRRTSGNFDRGWHTMAAFDVESIALHYAAECTIRANGDGDEIEYRVVPINWE